ncbi:MAG: ParB/RepB/Spo0J family partition protein [Thiolinea sp.]
MALNNLKNLASLAAAAKKPTGAQQVLKLPVDNVKPKASQVRKHFSGINELADSLIEEGQIQPIIVSPQGEDGLYEIQKGERRWRACKAAELPTIDAIINDEGQTALDATAGELIENIQRDDLTALEIAEALQVFVESGWKQKDIAKRIGKTVPFVSSHLSLLKMPASVMALYDKGVTRDPETLNNLRQLHKLNAERCEQLCESATTLGISRAHSREALNEIKRPGKKVPAAVPKPKEKTTIVSAHKRAVKGKNKTVPPEADDAPVLQTDGWRPARPSQLKFVVHVQLDGKTLKGYLRTDRVDEDDAHTWVEFDDGEVMRVAIEFIRLERIITR